MLGLVDYSPDTPAKPECKSELTKKTDVFLFFLLLPLYQFQFQAVLRFSRLLILNLLHLKDVIC